MKHFLMKYLNMRPFNSVVYQNIRHFPTVKLFDNTLLQFLLTNDKNLCNKAMINEVQAFTHDKIMSTLRPSQVSPEAKSRLATLANKGERIRQLVGHLFSYVILERTSKEFGPTLSKVALMKNPPWTLPDCLYRFEKLWISVFSGNLSKYFLKAVQDFKKFVSTHRSKF